MEWQWWRVFEYEDAHIDFHALISEAISIEMVTPKSYAQAISLPEKKKWIKAMDKEMKDITDAKTYMIKSCYPYLVTVWDRVLPQPMVQFSTILEYVTYSNM